MIAKNVLPLFAAMACMLGQISPATAATRPDIVVFLADDQSMLDTSLYGNLGLKTPNLEKLAEGGMTFNHSYVASPSCAPSRAALLTGLMPARNGAEANHSSPRPEIKKWPAYFQELGYQVYSYGKISHYKQTHMYGFNGFAHDTFHDNVAIDAAVDFLNERTRLAKSGQSTTATQPLCLMVGTNWPHVPWPNKARGIDKASLKLPPTTVDTPMTHDARAKFAAAVRNADNDLGKIMRSTRENLGTNTLFLFSTDHGTQWPFAKWNLYDAGIRVPLVVRWPGHIQPKTRSDAMVNWTDFLPTLLEAVGGTAPSGLDGKSFLPVLLGKKAVHRERIFTTHSGDGNWNIYPMRAVSDGKFKYIKNLHPEFAFACHIDLPGELGRMGYWGQWEHKAAQGGSGYPSKPQMTAPGDLDQKSTEFAAFTVNRYHARPAEELYDLSKDPHEQNNLADDAAYQQQLETMRNQVTTWMKAQGDQEKVYGDARLLTDFTKYGIDAEPKGKRKKNK